MGFNQRKYTREWDSKNMKYVGAKYKIEFVDEFKEACNTLGLVQSQVLKQAMQETINKAKEKQDD